MKSSRLYGSEVYNTQVVIKIKNKYEGYYIKNEGACGLYYSG